METEVDDVGFFVVIKLRDDIEKAKEVEENCKGSLGHLAGQERKVKKSHERMGEYNELAN